MICVMETITLIVLLTIPIIAFILRAIYLVYRITTIDCQIEKKGASLRTLICIGSGGHTTEMMRLIKNFNLKKYQPRLYITANNDLSSEVKVNFIENYNSNYKLSKIPRSRNVKQSYFSAIFSTAKSTICTIPVVYKFNPDIIFCNGPGTCVPVCFVAFILKCIFLCQCKIVFVESICRVRTLSLTGKILQYIADVFVVQWPQLKDECFRAKYFGRLT